ncbi:MAG: SUMF1/EgtB/PvdO family nonheme iron enzyme [Bacteroidia bacterium]|nr:SUMF1/EgtB/PvdO family nonheme iron enzyme [Bacteroidia bacterium]
MKYSDAMKKLLCILMLLMSPVLLSAQDYIVESVEHLPTDMTARTYIKKDGMDRQCAVLRFATQGIAPEKRDGFYFAPDFGSEVVEKSLQDGEIWVWVSPNIKVLRVKHAELGSYELHFTKYLPDAVQELHTYKVILKAVAVTPPTPEKTQYNYLIVKADQQNAMIYIDDVFIGTGSVSKSCKVGERHRWRIECSLYHTESGEAAITEGEKVKVERTLRPAFGYINITSTPESGATVLIDGNIAGTTPLKTDRIASGEHKIRVMKEMYSPTEKTVTVTDGNTTQAAVALAANFVNVTVSTDSGSDIYIDNELKGKGRWTGRLSDGGHTFEARKASHRSSFKNVTLTLGKDEDVSIPNPTPIYGTLDVNSDPMEAAIIIDGVRRGETPAIISDILIGTHELRLEKSGCATVTKTITLDETNLLAINEKLQTGREISITTDRQGDQIYADGNYLGVSPLTATLSFGSHNIKAVRNSTDPNDSKAPKAVEKTVTVAQTGGDSSVRLAFSDNKTFTVNGVTFEMVAVKGGTFTMGATSEQWSDAWDYEKPAHSVTLGDYYIGKFEVTQELWEAVMGSNPSSFKGSKLPVEKVSWDDCYNFIRKLNQLTGRNFRLPTEAEWEYAARGGSRSRGYKYSGSNSINVVAWYEDNSGKKPHPVGTKTPNELGIYDMSGNVWEWCQDWEGSYGSGSQTNPQGPSSGSYRVIRGGGWNTYSFFCRVSHRDGNAPGYRDYYLGFRLVVSQ